MNKLWTTVTVIILILVFVGYMIFDLVLRKDTVQNYVQETSDSVISDQWNVERVFDCGKGKLSAVAVSADRKIILAGDSFIACYDSELNLLWEDQTDYEVTAIASYSDKIYAAKVNALMVLNLEGKIIAEWGPYDEKSMITSVSANKNYVAFADAAGKSVYILDTGGEVKYIIGRSGEQFIVPSPYFDVALGEDNTLFVANTGNRRIERRKIDGTLIDYFGEAGLAPDSFCGCCNPAHFALNGDGFITAEKGVNRIKILNSGGEFNEFVSSVNNFLAPIPLDIAVSPQGETIFGANPGDSKLYVFKRKQL
ncbi:MAG: hypothetical protein HZB98_11475 [Bacteroidia bacterium]|nr:hypothetical protein [Bacteroidia bacterium]